ncbi:1-pyrroline-5-carboxylate dehydrogenase [Vibrio sp. S9_S30]|uniref:1-pyrroline-5-carboxylate dehydrogenase n=1 Tax=Vibrio sp. S9_S30 TaxID=2720226 RepID=UPI00167FEFC9|nr:1-pyrroline-5-carboxylate dehydrogenase [Vibrio sp. S9_S30]MBD1558089.1 1-pyrroline-5-carboxylate dehydrogenase [Vibrio sp. S9_S30]
MVHQVTCFSDAYTAWENWNLTGYEQRSAVMTSFSQALSQQVLAIGSVCSYHREKSEALLATPHLMPGPTGETNELYTAGRGVCLLLQDELSDAGRQAITAQLICALLAGNTVILSSDDEVLTQAIAQAVSSASLPAHLLQTIPRESWQEILECDVRSLGFVGSSEQEILLNRSLSNRNGAIVSFISETDLVGLPTALDPFLALRFVTERTRTINITAVGGNATLLELGSDDH